MREECTESAKWAKIYSEKEKNQHWRSGGAHSLRFCCKNIEKAGVVVCGQLEEGFVTLANVGDNLRNKTSLSGLSGSARLLWRLSVFGNRTVVIM